MRIKHLKSRVERLKLSANDATTHSEGKYKSLLTIARKRKERLRKLSQRKPLGEFKLFKKHIKRFNLYKVKQIIAMKENRFSKRSYKAIKEMLRVFGDFDFQEFVLSDYNIENGTRLIRTLLYNKLYQGSVAKNPLQLIKILHIMTSLNDEKETLKYQKHFKLVHFFDASKTTVRTHNFNCSEPRIGKKKSAVNKCRISSQGGCITHEDKVLWYDYSPELRQKLIDLSQQTDTAA